MGYDRGDSFPFDVEPNGIPFGSKSKRKLSPRSYPIQFERKWKYIFLSIVPRSVHNNAARLSASYGAIKADYAIDKTTYCPLYPRCIDSLIEHTSKKGYCAKPLLFIDNCTVYT